MTLGLLVHVPQLTSKNKKRLDHRRSQTTPILLFSTRNLPKTESTETRESKNSKNKEISYYRDRIREVFEEREKL